MGQAEEIGASLGMGWVMAAVRTLRRHQFGNVVLSRFPIVHRSQYDLSVSYTHLTLPTIYSV